MKTTNLLLSVICLAALSACGGGDEDTSRAGDGAQFLANATSASASRKVALAVKPSGLTPTEAMNWAEHQFPELFPRRLPDNSLVQNQTVDIYTYRYYPSTGNYLGIGNDSVYLAGPVAGQAKGANPIPFFYDDLYKFTADIKAGNNPEGLYVATNAIMLIENDGTTWFMDMTAKTLTENPAASTGKVTTADGRAMTLAAHSLASWDIPTDLSVAGAYEPKATFNFTVKGMPSCKDRNFLTSYDPAYNTVMNTPVSTFNDSKDFYSGDAIRLTTTVAGTFTGQSGGKAPDPACNFNGQLTPTTKGYQKVAITFGAGCVEIPTGTKGNGVLIRYVDGIYLLMTTQLGRYGEIQPFVTFLTVPGTKVPANLMLTARSTAL